MRAKRVVQVALTRHEADELKWLLRKHMTQFGHTISDWRENDGVWATAYDEIHRARKEAQRGGSSG